MYKAIVYLVSRGGPDWHPSEAELEYLGRTQNAPDLLTSEPEIIYCFEDPEYEKRVESVARADAFTAAADILPSSYIWFPEGRPDLLVACPFHHIAVRADDGSIVEWRGR